MGVESSCVCRICLLYKLIGTAHVPLSIHFEVTNAAVVFVVSVIRECRVAVLVQSRPVLQYRPQSIPHVIRICSADHILSLVWADMSKLLCMCAAVLW